MKKYLEVGSVINKRGLKGELKVDVLCDSLEVFCDLSTIYLDEEGKSCRCILSAKPYKGYAYIIIEGVDSAEKADEMRGKMLYASRDEIEIDEDRVFIEDVLGLHVYDEKTGVDYGVVTDVSNYGASDIFTIEKDGTEYRIPAVDEFVTEIDVSKGVFVRPIRGMFDEDD